MAIRVKAVNGYAAEYREQMERFPHPPDSLPRPLPAAPADSTSLLAFQFPP